MNRRARQIELQALPVSSAIEGCKHTGLGGRIQQVGSGRILAHHVNEGALREAAANRRPGLAAVAGPEDVGLEVIELVTVDRDIRGRSEEHTSELQSRLHLVCRPLLEKKKPLDRP